MTKFYANVEQEITDFIHRCHDMTTSVNITSNQSSIPCLTTISFDIFSLAVEHLNIFLHFLSSYTSDMPIECEQIIAIVSNSSDLVNYVNNFQYLFIEHAIDDYFFLDEHFDLIYEKALEILHYLHDLSTISAEIYNLEKQLLFHLPSNYSNQISSSLSSRITATLIDQTSRLLSSSYHSSNDNNEDDDDDDGIMPSSYLFSSSPKSINYNVNKTNISSKDSLDQSKSLLQLEKIDIRTTLLTPSFQFDLTDFEQIENDLNNENDWIKIERDFCQNIISIWSNEELNILTINPWSSETFWTLITHFKYSDMNLKYDFILIIQWCFCLLTIHAFNRDWDLLYSKTLINTIITNRWRIVCFSRDIYLSSVGDSLNQMFLRLTRIISVLQHMKILSDQSSYLTSSFTNIISSNINNLTKRIEGTFQLLIVWLDQHADTFINGNSLERTLVICKSDQIQLSTSINSLINSLRQLKSCEKSVKLVEKLHSSCQKIVNDTMLKLYRRIQINTTNYFSHILPLTTTEWRASNQQISYMIVACDKLLKPVLSQSECLNIDTRFDVYDKILSSFIQAWTSILLERKYRFSDEMVNYLQRDYEYLQTFLSSNICDQRIVILLIRSSSIEQVSRIIDLLRTGEKNGSRSSMSQLPDHDKWLRSRESSSPFLDLFLNACCCQRRNRVTTGPS